VKCKEQGTPYEHGSFVRLIYYISPMPRSKGKGRAVASLVLNPSSIPEALAELRKGPPAGLPTSTAYSHYGRVFDLTFHPHDSEIIASARSVNFIRNYRIIATGNGEVALPAPSRAGGRAGVSPPHPTGRLSSITTTNAHLCRSSVSHLSTSQALHVFTGYGFSRSRCFFPLAVKTRPLEFGV